MTKPENSLRVYESIVDLIADQNNPTPMVRLNERINQNIDFPIYLKLERYNPFGSIKDRIALSMLGGTEIKEGQSLVEPSSGNTGIALAAIANAKGIPIEIVVPERIPEEKKTLLKYLYRFYVFLVFGLQQLQIGLILALFGIYSPSFTVLF